MRTKLALCIICGLNICLSACSNMPEVNGQPAFSLTESKTFEQSEFNYEILSEIYMNVNMENQIDIRVEYPQIKGISSTVKQDQINKQIKSVALKPYDKFFNDGKDIETGTECQIQYSMVYLSNSIISIKFDGSIFTKGNASGINTLYAININLNTGDEITLDELFHRTLLEKLNYDVFESLDIDIEKGSAGIQNEIFDRFKNSFMDDNNNFYFGLKDLTIILPISNYFRFAANYEDLQECMKSDNPLWQEILRADISE